jgi:glycosyltransferase involved in cell wall biosynthesis
VSPTSPGRHIRQSEIRISVIIPAYNAGRFIGEAVRSVLEQNAAGFELLVVNDGSTDATADILISLDDPRIRVFRQENRGVCAARNLGLREARGEFVVFMDADDVMLPGKLRAQLALFDAFRPNIRRLEIIHSGWTMVSADGAFLTTIKPWETAPDLDLETWLLRKPVFPGALMLDRRAVRDAGGFDESLTQAEDVDLILRLSAGGSRARWLYRPTILYRQHGENAILDGWKQASNLAKVMDKFFSMPDLPRKIRKIERRARYNTLMWLIWRLHQTGHADAVPRYLRESREVSPYRPPSVLTVVDWQMKIVEHALNAGVSPDIVRSFWPAMCEASDLQDGDWESTKASLAFHLDVWLHQAFRDAAAVAAQKSMSPAEISEAGAPVIFVAPWTRPADLKRVHRSLRDAGFLKGRKSPDISALYLTLAARKLYERGVRDFLGCIAGIIACGAAPRTLRPWRKTMAKAWRALKTRWRRSGT